MYKDATHQKKRNLLVSGAAKEIEIIQRQQQRDTKLT